MKQILLACLIGSLFALPDAHAQIQRPDRSAKTLFSAPHNASRAEAAVTAHRSIATTVPGRSVRHNWDNATNRWQDGTVEVNTYDARGNVTQIIYSDSVTSQPSRRELYAYNLRNQVTEATSQAWVGTAYVNEQRSQFTYDAQGNRTLQIYQSWSGTAWTTESGYRTTNTYNAANTLTSQVFEELDANNTWKNNGRVVYTVDANNQWTEAVEQEWTNNAYVNKGRIRAVTWHDWTKQLPSYYEMQDWDNGAWVDAQRSTITYQPNGSNVEVQQQATAPNTWANDSRFTVTYDNFGNELLSQEETWNNNSWVIMGGQRTLLAYTVGNQVRRAALQDYDAAQNRYVNYQVYTYSNFVALGTRRATDLEAAATSHPNPTAGSTTFRLSGLPEQGLLRLEVLNTLGQVVQQLSVRAYQGAISQELNLASLPAGMYMVRLHTNEGTVAKRVVKQ